MEAIDWAADQASWLGPDRVVEVKVRGRGVPVRRLTVAQMEAIERVFPLPAPPLGANPAKGSKSKDLVPLVNDPRYRAEMLEADHWAEMARVAVATSDEPAITRDGRFESPRAVKEWVERCAKGIGLLHAEELERIKAAIRGDANGEGDPDPSPSQA